MFNPCRHVGGWGWGGDLNVALRVAVQVAHFPSARPTPAHFPVCTLNGCMQV